MCELNQEDLGQVLANIESFNEHVGNLCADFLMSEQFTGPLVQWQERIPCLVFATDLLFRTNLESHEMHQIIQALRGNWQHISALLNNANLNIQDNPEGVFQVAEVFLGLVFNATERNLYSFATKFFHWCTRCHFPIMDQRARTAIHDFQIGHNAAEEDMIPEQQPAGIENLIADYGRWIRFYSSLINHNAGALIQIQQHDNQTQAGGAPFQIHNTLLRILDKHFYVAGGAHNQ